MNEAARDAMVMAASEYDRCASKVETMADLLRQIACHARRGEIAEIERIREQIANLSDVGDDLARQLVDSVRGRDPEHWLDEKRKEAIRIVGKLPVHVLSHFASVHASVCQDGANCQVLRVARERIAAGR